MTRELTTARIAGTLADAEQRLVALCDAWSRCAGLAGGDEPVPSLDRILAPVLQELRAIRAELDPAPLGPPSHQAVVLALAAIWCELDELAPARPRRAGRARSVPAEWARLQTRLIEAIERAGAALDQARPEDATAVVPR
jgi:hypothetical protein